MVKIIQKKSAGILPVPFKVTAFLKAVAYLGGLKGILSREVY
jgi:hypothetical protein